MARLENAFASRKHLLNTCSLGCLQADCQRFRSIDRVTWHVNLCVIQSLRCL
uniref:Uncharacterized protein n=1 Tax=Physcomitrium patens TaxID=3218 RepID=A0A2K1KN15_PHYPA|nr:hypothetical protein PHYPA_006065 [Physcomitrium patens]